eukprot:5524986-Pleurochrysis_carterae.AAC.3
MRLKPHAVVNGLEKNLSSHKNATGKVRFQQLSAMVLPFSQVLVLPEAHQVILHFKQHAVRVAVGPHKIVSHEGLAVGPVSIE